MEFMTQVYAVGIVLILYFIPMFSLIGIVLYFKKANSKNRVSPLTSDLLRPSGYTLQKQIDDLYADLMGHFMMAPVAGSMALFMLLVQAQFFDKQLSSTSWVTTAIISLSALVWVITKAIKTTQKLHRLRLGYSCEMAVGQELEHLVRPETSEYRVFHDIPFDNFNIDHLVVSPNGVFVIETKGRSKPVTDAGKQYRVIVKGNALHFPHHVETEPLEQTRRNVKSVRQWLTETTGFQVEVAGVLVLPGWYVELKQRSVDPYIMNAAGLPKVLPKLRAGNGLLEPGQVQAIAYQVEQKVRDVKRDSKTQVK